MFLGARNMAPMNCFGATEPRPNAGNILQKKMVQFHHRARSKPGSEPALWRGSGLDVDILFCVVREPLQRIDDLAGGFNSKDRQSGIRQESDLFEYGCLVPIDVLMHEFAVSKFDNV